MDRLRSEDYYTEALGILGEWGSNELTIAALCERLGVTKGSFYHHFASMTTFVAQLLTYWESEHSDRLIAASKSQPDATLRISMLIDVAAGLPHASEAAIRAWGRSNTEVADVIARVDRRRERHLVDAVAALGVDRTRARVLGRLALNVLVGAQQREQRVDVKRLRQTFEEVKRLVFAEADPDLVARLREVAG